MTVYAAASLGRIGVFLRGKAEYRHLMWAKRKQIAAQIGALVAWNGEDEQWSVGATIKADPTNREDWFRQHRWLALRLNEFVGMFKSFVSP